MSDKDKIAGLNRQRGTYKGQLTKLATYLDNEEAKDPVELEIKLNSLRKWIEKLDELKIKYYDTVKEDSELEIHLEVFSSLEDEAEKLEVRLRKFLLSNNSKNEIITNDRKLDNSDINFRLPEIPLPKFNGSYSEWYNFKDQFNVLIDQNEKLSDNQKLYYLKSTLSGKARDIITEDDSYESLLKALEERFQNKRMIVNSHLNEIINIENLSQDVVKNLRTITDSCQKNIRALKSIGLELNAFAETLLINLILKQLDKESKKQYELSLNSTELPTWSEFVTFLQKRCLVLENLQNTSNIKPKQNNSEKSVRIKTFFAQSNSGNEPNCNYCSKKHPLSKCSEFLKLNEHERYLIVKKYLLCICCLKPKHRMSNCRSKLTCNICFKRHNTLLHRSSPASKPNDNFQSDLNKENSLLASDNSHLLVGDTQSATLKETKDISTTLYNEINSPIKNKKQVMLSTSIVYLESSNNKKIAIRAILDNGSQCSILEREIADLLNLQKKKCDIHISGINGKITNAKSSVRTIISNKDDSFRKPIEFLLTPKITELIPSQDINIKNLNLPQDFELADSEFWKKSKVNALIGAEFFYEILKADKFKIGQFTFQNSVFGHIATGTIVNNVSENTFCGFTACNDFLNENIQKFWKIENTENDLRPISDEESFCENHFLKTYRRDKSGRFIVTMPLKEDISILGDSKIIAEKRLKQL